MGTLAVSATCNGVTPTGHTASILLIASKTATVHVSNPAVVTVVQGSVTNNFIIRPLTAGTTTVTVQDDQGEDVNETETVDDVNESPEPDECGSPEPVETGDDQGESGSPAPAESPEPCESEEPEPTPSASATASASV
jgi:hypothetical protein